MTRVIGPRPEITEYEPDMLRAWKRSMALDAMLRGTLPPHPRGVFRGTHEFLEKMGQERALLIARRINGM